MSEIRKRSVPIEVVRESEKKSKEKTESEKKVEIAEALTLKKEKEKFLGHLEKDKKLAFLKSMVERGLIAVTTAESIVSGEGLNTEEIEEIFEKIDEIESTHDIDRILPKNLRVSKDEYLIALRDETARSTTLSKIDSSLAHIHASANPSPYSALNFFGGFMAALDKNLVRVQENTIDIKRSLVSISVP